MTQREMHGDYPEYSTEEHPWKECPHNEIDLSICDWSTEIKDDELYLCRHDMVKNTTHYYKLPAWVKRLLEFGKAYGREEIESKLRDILETDNSEG